MYFSRCPIVSEKPLRLTVKAEGPDKLRLRWEEPDYNGGGEITGYRIEGNQNNAWRTLEPDTRSTQTDYLHVGLEPAETWTYRVLAINEAGIGPPSDLASGTTDPIAPDPPRNLRAESVGSDRIDIRWHPPDFTGGADLIGYRIEASRDRVTWDLLVRNSNHIGTTYSHEDLPPASTWHYRVYAINEGGISRASRQASATTDAVKPDAPESVIAIAEDYETILLRWEPPRFTGGSPILGYKIEFSEDEGRQWIVLEYNVSETEYLHRGLEPATVYSYRVYAINGIGTGPASTMTTTRTDARVPDPPLNLTAEAVLPTQVDLDWDPPEYDGGAEVTGYVVEATEMPEEGWEVVARVKASQWSHEELRSGQTWFYRVQALNAAGPSDYSNIAEATTDDTSDRIRRLNQGILPRFASGVASGIVRSVSDRLDAIVHNRVGHMNLASIESVGTGGLGALIDGASASRSVGSRLSAWGNIEKLNMDAGTSGGDLKWEGEVLSVYTGSDIEIANGLYVGLSGSYASGHYSVTDFAWDAEVEGKYKVGMTSMTPYIGWLPTNKIVTWASGSYGFGSIEVEEGARAVRRSSAKMWTGAGGLIGKLISSDFGGISLRAEAWISRLNVEQGLDFDEMMLDLRRVRAVLEWLRMSTDSDHEFSLLVNAGVRHDFNVDLQNHSGFEFGGGGGYTSPSRRMRITAIGRVLVTTDADYSEWGLGGSIFMEPAPSGGFAVKVEPSYGSYQSGVQQLWNSGVKALTNERQFIWPALVEYHVKDVVSYLRLNDGKAFVGMSYRNLSIEGLGGEKPGLGVKGQWGF